MKYSTYYFWDITGGKNTKNTIYKVEYKGKEGTINTFQRLVAEDKARRKCFDLYGDRKCMKQVNSGFNPYSTNLKIVLVPFDTKPLKKWKGNSRKAIAEFDYGDEVDYEMFLEILSEKMGKNTFFKISGRCINWLNHSGVKYIQAENAKELLQSIYSEDILYLYNGKKKNHFEINAPTHDTPMGSFYYFTPISERNYNQNN